MLIFDLEGINWKINFNSIDSEKLITVIIEQNVLWIIKEPSFDVVIDIKFIKTTTIKYPTLDYKESKTIKPFFVCFSKYLTNIECSIKYQ